LTDLKSQRNSDDFTFVAVELLASFYVLSSFVTHFEITNLAHTSCKMADGMEVESANAATFIANKEEKSEITCIRCAELELELVRTRIELKSAMKIVEMLREWM
jgi:hypothetical protein